MNLQLNEPWLTDKATAGGCAAAATRAELLRKPGSTAAGEPGNHSHLELTLGMPSSYPSSPDHHRSSAEAKGRATAHGCAAALFAAHGAADKATASAHAAPLCYQIPGFSSSSSGLGAKRWFSETAAAAAAPAATVTAGVGFVHPWSLAARQEKAALEQAARAMVASNNQPSAAPPLLAAVSRPTQPPPVVGWPPIRTYRKNVITNPPHMQKLTVEEDDEKEAKKSKPCEKEEKPTKEEIKPSSMFVKVNMEGFTVGRKIDLLAHDGYESLSRALHKMFDTFLSVKHTKIGSQKDNQGGAVSRELVLLYEDNEGDRMLVGDVPWEMFVCSVKRLYISTNPKLHGSVGEEKENIKKECEAVRS